jgi:tRNA A-37 threonylcarbamoyl transferase component Bud32
VNSAVSELFGASTPDLLRPITGGVSGALIFQFRVSGRSFVLRLEPERVALIHRQRAVSCMSLAAEAGAAPRVYFADPQAGLVIMAHVSSRPLSEHPGGQAGLARGLGALTARVHGAAPFPIMGDYPDMIAGLLNALSTSGRMTPGLVDTYAEGLGRIRAALRWDPSALVSSHNDPNPRNILFDGERLWLVDWELACRNDPLVDLAIITNDLAETPELEDILLEAALGRAPDRSLRARLRLVRLLTRLFYGCIVLDSLPAALLFRIGNDAPALTPSAFRQATADGRLVSGAPETAHAFALMSLAAFTDGLRENGFEEVLNAAAQG